MSHAIIIPCHSTLNRWDAEIEAAVAHQKIHGLTKVVVVGDGNPGAAKSFCENPVRAQAGVFEAVATDWSLGAGKGAMQRNQQAGLDTADWIVVLGSVAGNSTARHMLARAFSRPSVKVVQVIEGQARSVGSENIVGGPIEVKAAVSDGAPVRNFWSAAFAPTPPKRKK